MPRWWFSTGRIYRVKEVRTYPANEYRTLPTTHTTYYGPYTSLAGARSFAGKRRNNIQGPSTAVVIIEYADAEWNTL